MNPGGSEIFHTCPDWPWGPPSLLYNGYRIFPGGKERPGRDADPLLVPCSRKGRAIPLLPLWAVLPVQSLSATRVHFTFTFLPTVMSHSPTHIRHSLSLRHTRVRLHMCYDCSVLLLHVWSTRFELRYWRWLKDTRISVDHFSNDAENQLFFYHNFPLFCFRRFHTELF